MLIFTDNDVEGPVEALRRILQSGEWAEDWALLGVRFTSFEELGIPRHAKDREVYQTCLRVGALLITGNRAGGVDSLDQAIHELSSPDSLPVITVADAQRVVCERGYAEAAALRLLEFLERIDSLHGTGRLYIP
jgi:hypothetical protein